MFLLPVPRKAAEKDDKRTRQTRAWLLKELALDGPLRWYSWAIRSHLERLKRAARMVMRHLDGVRNAIYFHLGGLDLYPEAVFHSNSSRTREHRRPLAGGAGEPGGGKVIAITDPASPR